jgi:uncharacterized membrane protein YhaH (DUF805 family)
MSIQIDEQPIRHRGIATDFRLIGRAVWLTFTIAGRTSRTEYALFMLVGGWLAAICGDLLSADPVRLAQSNVIAAAIFLVPVPALVVRRLHDVGISGWWALPFIGIALIALALGVANGMLSTNLILSLEALRPWIGFGTDLIGFALVIFFLVITVLPPQDENQFGPDPRLV